MERISGTYTCNASADNELSCGAIVGADTANLNDNTENHDEAANEDRLATTELITTGKHEAGTKETSDGVDGGNETFPGLVTTNLGKTVHESRVGDNTGHDTLVIAEEEEVGSCDDSNHLLQA